MLLQTPCCTPAPPSANSLFDLIFKSLAVVVALVGGLWTAWKYRRDRKDAAEKELVESKRANDAAELESRKPFALKQQAIYFELLETTAFLSNRYQNDPEWDTYWKKFWILFWGAVPVVEDEEVARELDAFAEQLDYLGSGDGIPLRNASMNLARACRHSLGESWNADLKPVTKSTQTRGENPPAP
jgi:hypothetical protein